VCGNFSEDDFSLVKSDKFAAENDLNKETVLKVRLDHFTREGELALQANKNGHFLEEQLTSIVEDVFIMLNGDLLRQTNYRAGGFQLLLPMLRNGRGRGNYEGWVEMWDGSIHSNIAPISESMFIYQA
jgi:hypothetical protein